MDRHRLFRKLLDQLKLGQLSDQDPYRTGIIKKLEIHTKSRCWCLYIGLKSIWTYRQFIQFYHQLRLRLASVTTRFQLIIQVRHPQITGKLLQSYWQWVIRHCNLSSSTVSQMSGTRLSLRHQQIILLVPNSVVGHYLKKQDLRPVSRLYAKLGFSSLGIQILVQDHTKHDLKRLHRNQQRNNAKVIHLATNSLNRQRSERHLQAMGIGQLIYKQSPVTKLIDVNHESRSVVVQGVVQAEKEQDLLSGRQLLLLTLADQTASIQVKIFAKNRGGRRASSSIKKGMHLKVQGAVRPDQATQQLMINAYNINPLAVKKF